MNILGCEVSVGTLEAWSGFFVFELESIFLTTESRALLPKSISRNELKPSLEFADAYLTYSVSNEAQFVVLLKPEEFRALPRGLQNDLMALQKQLGRGQIYDLEFVRDVLGEIAASLEPDIFIDHFVLRHDVWHGFTPEIRYRWLAAYVSLDRLNCLSSIMPENTWAALPEHVRRLAGRFSSSSGANCFAAVIAGLTSDLLESTRISNFWMLEDEFLGALEAQGFHEGEKLELPVKPNSVITFINSSGMNIHACLMLEHGLVLNKDAQRWFAPSQILRLKDVLKSWQEDSAQLQVWTRTSI